MTRAAAIAAVTAGLALGGIWASGAFGDPGIPGTPATVFRTVTETRTVDRRIEGHSGRYWYWRNQQHIGERNDANLSLRQARQRIRRETLAERRRSAPTVLYALRLASSVYGVPYSKLNAVAYCESTLSPYAVNGQYRGLFQEGSMFERGPFSAFSVWDPIANALTAAYTASREGWGQWSCG